MPHDLSKLFKYNRPSLPSITSIMLPVYPFALGAFLDQRRPKLCFYDLGDTDNVCSPSMSSFPAANCLLSKYLSYFPATKTRLHSSRYILLLARTKWALEQASTDIISSATCGCRQYHRLYEDTYRFSTSSPGLSPLMTTVACSLSKDVKKET